MDYSNSYEASNCDPEDGKHRFDSKGQVDNPDLLQNLCLFRICADIDLLCEQHPVADDADELPRLKFRTGGAIYLHTILSELLMLVLSKNGKMNDKRLTLFDHHYARLKKVKLNQAAELSKKGLSVLKGHKVTHLEMQSLSQTDANVILDKCLNEWSTENLKTLILKRCSLFPVSGGVLTFKGFNSLTTLNVSSTRFNMASLECAVNDLPMLESLDISMTNVYNIFPLKYIKTRLKSLNLYGVNLAVDADGMAATIKLLTEMVNLQHLDISDEREVRHPMDMISMISPNRTLPTTSFLVEAKNMLPNLMSLDLSGKVVLAFDFPIFCVSWILF